MHGPEKPLALRAGFAYSGLAGPVAQLDRVLPSEGKGRTFESSRVRHQLPVS